VEETAPFARSEPAQLRLPAVQAQAIVLGLEALRYESPDLYASRIAAELLEPVRHGICKSLGVEPEQVTTWLSRLSKEELSVLQQKTQAFWKVPHQESFPSIPGSPLLPSLAVLAHVGLIEPESHAWWGYCNVKLNNERSIEFDPGVAGLGIPAFMDNVPADQGSQILVRLVREHLLSLQGAKKLQGPKEGVAYEGLMTCQAFALATHLGSRYLRVVEDAEGDVRFFSIPATDLLSDINQGYLEGLVVEGINAPLTE
jgi:hypothetical protein